MLLIINSIKSAFLFDRGKGTLVFLISKKKKQFCHLNVYNLTYA